MKKRMEKKILVTFVMVAIIGIITEGICGVFYENRKTFITFDTIAGAGMLALLYLVCIGNNNIRRHKKLIILGIIDFFVIMLFLIMTIISQGESEIFTPITYMSECIILSIIFISVSIIGVYHGKELLEEDRL